MTVTPAVYYAAPWFLAIAAFLVWYFASKMADAKDALDQQLRINVSNSKEHARIEALFVAGVLHRAELKGPLPSLTTEKWSTLQDLYDDPAMMAYNIPAQQTTDAQRFPVIYWKHGDVTELDSYQLARMWLAGVL